MAKDKLFVKISNTDTAPMLSLNLDALSSKVAEVEEMSITPRTFISRTFNAGILNQDPNKQTDLDDYWFVDEYRNQKGLSVVRFGIDRNSIIAKYDKDQDAYLLLEEKIKVTQKDDNVSSNTSKKSTQYLPNIAIHHTLEKFLLVKAIDYLRAGSKQTVLLHIFERTDGEINLDDSRSPKTHTVLLYNNSPESSKVGKIQVVVIDPTNFTFSSHLRDLNADANFKDVEIITFHGKDLKIYSAKGDVGPRDSSHYRDCADISAKIAFAFQDYSIKYGKLLIKTSKVDSVSINDLSHSVPVLQVLSNNTKLDPDLLDPQNAVRIKQTSEIGTVVKFHALSSMLGSLIKNFAKLSNLDQEAKIQKDAALLENMQLALSQMQFDADNNPCYDAVFQSMNSLHIGCLGEIEMQWKVFGDFE